MTERAVNSISAVTLLCALALLSSGAQEPVYAAFAAFAACISPINSAAVLGLAVYLPLMPVLYRRLCKVLTQGAQRLGSWWTAAESNAPSLARPWPSAVPSWRQLPINERAIKVSGATQRPASTPLTEASTRARDGPARAPSIANGKTKTADGQALFVHGIHDSVSKDDVVRHFSQYGTVTRVVLAVTALGARRGYGWVTFSSLDDATALHQRDVDMGGRRMRLLVTHARSRASTNAGSAIARGRMQVGAPAPAPSARAAWPRAGAPTQHPHAWRKQAWDTVRASAPAGPVNGEPPTMGGWPDGCRIRRAANVGPRPSRTTGAA